VAVVTTAVLVGPVGASVRISFDPNANERPEGIVVDARGNTFVSLAPLGEIRKIRRDGRQSTFATISPAGQGFGPVGMAFDDRGSLFVAAATFDSTTTGVYRVGRHHPPVRIPGSEQIGLPNGLAFAPSGSLFVTDSSNGAVWRITRGGDVTRWSADSLLAGDGSLGLGVPLGANGIAYRRGSLYVTVTETGRIVRIPVTRHERAGTPQVVAEGAAFVGADGCQFDVRGGLFIAVNSQNEVVRLAPDGGVTTVATAADGLDGPASPIFGVTRHDRKTLFVTNFALGHSNPADARPGVLAFDVGVQGAHLPANH